MARHTHGIRESGAHKSGRNLEGQWCAELSMFLGRKGTANTGRHSLVKSPDSPLWHSSDSILNLFSERRRIVAQVRRKAPKYRGSSLSKILAFDVKFC